VLAKERFEIRERQLEGEHSFIAFTAQTRMSGLDFGGRQIRKGAAESVKRWVTEHGGTVPADLDGIVERVSRSGSTPLAVADGPDILGVIELKDVVKQGIQEKFEEMRRMGIRTVMITGDNPSRRPPSLKKPVSTTFWRRLRPRPRWRSSKPNRKAASSSP